MDLVSDKAVRQGLCRRRSGEIADGRLAREFDAIVDHWSPRVIADATGQYVEIADVSGGFVGHAHAEEDEFFLVHRGTFVLRFRDDSEVTLNAGKFFVVPRGVEHLPFAPEACWIMFGEPALPWGAVPGDADLEPSLVPALSVDLHHPADHFGASPMSHGPEDGGSLSKRCQRRSAVDAEMANVRSRRMTNGH